MYFNILFNMNKIFDEIFNLNPKITTSISFILGLLLTSDLDTAEQNMLANFLYLTAQTILTNAASQHLIEAKINGERANINSKEVKSYYNPIIYDMDKIKKILNEVYPNKSEEIQIIEKAIKNLEDKINELKKD